jgi:transketolase
LYLLGYDDFSLEDIKNFRQLGAKTAGHPEYGHGAGIETTTGPLGQGLGNAVGMAIAERKQEERFGKDLVNHHTYVLAGDGCLMEGISQEALSLAGHLKLNKLIVIWDNNSASRSMALSRITDSTDQVARFAASGWNTLNVDGHDPDGIAAAIRQAQASDKPTLIAAKTTIGFGAPTKAGTAKGSWRSRSAPRKSQAPARHSNWPHEPFEVPSDILDAWRIAGLRSVNAHKDWQKRFNDAENETRA